MDSVDIWNDRYKNGDTTVAKINRGEDPVDYTSHPFLFEHAVKNWFKNDEWNVNSIGEEFFKPVRKEVCAIGSGLGINERQMVRQGYIEHLTVYETSISAINELQKLLIEDGIQTKVSLVNADILEESIPDNVHSFSVGSKPTIH